MLSMILMLTGSVHTLDVTGAMGTTYFGTYGGDAYVLGLFQDINLVGRWCDDYSAIPDRVHPFICESVI